MVLGKKKKLFPLVHTLKKIVFGKDFPSSSPLPLAQTKSEWTNDWLIALKFSSCQGFGSSGGPRFVLAHLTIFVRLGGRKLEFCGKLEGKASWHQVGFSAKNCKTINNCSNQRISDVWGETTVVRESAHTHTHTASRLLHLGKQTKSQK